MEELVRMKCVACRKDAPKLTQEQIAELLPQISEWKLVEREQTKQLERVYKFKNFSQALLFTIRIGALAEEEDHHPVLLIKWGQVTVTWWTHIIKGLHRNDFIMAAKTDQTYTEIKT